MDKKIIFIIGGGAALLIIIVLAVALSASHKAAAPAVSNQPITLNVWMTFEDSANLDPIFQDYHQLHPNVTIIYTKKDETTYESDLLNALAAGTGPDIFAINNAWLPAYMDKVVPLPAKDADSTFNIATYKQDFLDVVNQDFTQNNQIYGVAMSVDTLGLYYNKDILGSAGIATPPQTWDQLAQDVQTIRRQNSVGYFSTSGVALGTSSNISHDTDILYLLMLQQGVTPYTNNNTTPTFAQSVQQNGNSVNPGDNALSFYTSFANPTSPNYNWNTQSDYSIDAFANGRLAFMYGYSYDWPTILAKNPNLNFNVAPVPQPNLDNPSVNFSNYWGEVVSKQSKNPDAAWDLLKYLSSNPVLNKYYAATKEPSSRNDLISLQVQDPQIGVFANAGLTSEDFYRPDQVQMDGIFSNAIDNVTLHGLSVDQSLQQAQAQAQTLTSGQQ